MGIPHPSNYFTEEIVDCEGIDEAAMVNVENFPEILKSLDCFVVLDSKYEIKESFVILDRYE